MKTKSGKKGLLAVFLAVLIDLLGFGIVLPLLPYTASRFNAEPLTVGLLYSVYSLAQLIFSPLWGAWSDRIGRRPVMLLSTAGSALSYVLFAFSGSLSTLFLSRLFAGIMGGNISAAQAYVADVTEPSQRAKGMGMIGAAFGIGFALGPAITSLLLLPSLRGVLAPMHLPAHVLESPYALPGFTAAFLSVCIFLLVLFTLPESLPAKTTGSSAEADSETRIQRSVVWSRRFWISFLPGAGAASGPPMLFLCLFILTLGHSSLYSAFPLFCKHRLHLDAREVGMQFLVMGGVAIFIQGGLIRVLVSRFGERKLLIVGNILMAAAFFLIPTAPSPVILSFYLVLLATGGSLNGPTLTSLISKRAGVHQMGLAMGNAQGISALARVLGPAWGGWLFGWKWPAPFWMTGVLICATIWIGTSYRTAEIS